MSKCLICQFNGDIDLCMNAELRLLGGEDCSFFVARKPQICIDNLCLICGGINDQEHLGYQYCSKCGKES